MSIVSCRAASSPGDGVNRIRRGQILGDDARVHAMRSRQLAGERGETVRAARHEDHVRAPRCEQPGKLFADAAGSAGDKGCVGHGVMLSLISGLGARGSGLGRDWAWLPASAGHGSPARGCRDFETRGQFTIHATATYRAALPMTVQIEKARKGMWAAPASATSASPMSGTHDNSSAGGP